MIACSLPGARPFCRRDGECRRANERQRLSACRKDSHRGEAIPRLWPLPPLDHLPCAFETVVTSKTNLAVPATPDRRPSSRTDKPQLVTLLPADDAKLSQRVPVRNYHPHAISGGKPFGKALQGAGAALSLQGGQLKSNGSNTRDSVRKHMAIASGHFHRTHPESNLYDAGRAGGCSKRTD
jgi:hypothetical protein